MEENRTQSMSARTGLREDRTPSSPVTQKREVRVQAWGVPVLWLLFGFLKQEVKSQGKEFERITSGRRQKWIRTIALPGRVGNDPEFVMMLICSTIQHSLTGLACLADGCYGKTRA